jgi:hypothetical protein
MFFRTLSEGWSHASLLPEIPPVGKPPIGMTPVSCYFH